MPAACCDAIRSTVAAWWPSASRAYCGGGGAVAVSPANITVCSRGEPYTSSRARGPVRVSTCRALPCPSQRWSVARSLY